jgi:hypothetical protein
VSAESVGRDMADEAINAGVTAGINYAVGFLTGSAAAFLTHGKTDLAQAFTAAAAELRTVTPEQARRDEPKL